VNALFAPRSATGLGPVPVGLPSGSPSAPTPADVPRAYTAHADLYEEQTGVHHFWRKAAVDLLPLHGGDVVLDVGCGSGLCFPMLESKIGAEGTIVGVDESPEMLALAAGRCVDHSWRNVALVSAPVERAWLPVCAHAALFCAVHDILQSPEALQNVFDHLHPEAWVAACGGKWAAPWLVPLNMFVLALHEPYVRNFTGFDRPWRHLEPLLEDFRVKEVAFGGGYLAVGRARVR
jgi:trans-aconitate methyltransferase